MAEIRPYTDRDYLGVEQNLREAGSFEDVADARENLQAMVTENPNSVLVATIGNEVVGTVYTTPFGINLLFIWKLATAKKVREQGIATQLLEEVEKRASPDVKEIWGYIDVDRENLPSFYINRGYNHVADHAYNPIWKTIGS